MSKIWQMRTDLEQCVGTLSGKRISKVRYYEVDYYHGDPNWDCHQALDSVDFGVELEVDTGQTYSIFWDSEFTSYGISLMDRNLKEKFHQAAIWDVTETSRWSVLINKPINRGLLYWSKVTNSDGSSTNYPQEIELFFQTGEKVFFSAAQYSSGSLFGISDNIVIIFQDDVAQSLKVGPYGVK